MNFFYKTWLTGKLLAAAMPAFAAAAPQAAFAQSGTQMPFIIYGESRLPAAVRQMRERLLKAAKSGNIAALRPLFSVKDGGTRFTPADTKQDPITYLKQISADGSGLEILANLVQILQSGAVKQNINGQIIYVWPYFTAISPKTLTPAQIVEAYEIMSADDLDTIKEIGRYIYFRTGISADGSWRFFLTGDDGNSGEKAAGEAEESGDAALPNRAALPSPDDSDGLPDE